MRGCTNLSLLKTVNYREGLRIFPCDSICPRFHALVPVSQPSVAGTRACRLATSVDRPLAGVARIKCAVLVMRGTELAQATTHSSMRRDPLALRAVRCETAI